MRYFAPYPTLCRTEFRDLYYYRIGGNAHTHMLTATTKGTTEKSLSKAIELNTAIGVVVVIFMTILHTTLGLAVVVCHQRGGLSSEMCLNTVCVFLYPIWASEQGAHYINISPASLYTILFHIQKLGDSALVDKSHYNIKRKHRISVTTYI